MIDDDYGDITEKNSVMLPTEKTLIEVKYLRRLILESERYRRHSNVWKRIALRLKSELNNETITELKNK